MLRWKSFNGHLLEAVEIPDLDAVVCMCPKCGWAEVGDAATFWAVISTLLADNLIAPITGQQAREECDDAW